MASQTDGRERRPSAAARFPTAPSVMTMNGHFAGVGDAPTKEQYEHGIQVIDEEKEFNPHLNMYLQLTKIAQSGFNYHLISVFGSQSTGKSTLLNHLFGTDFGVMSETERRQTTKGIWMSKNKREHAEGPDSKKMAENILVMDVEGTDGRERGEDQDFERKSALFALATSEVLIVNIWEHQVGLYQGANMGLLKTVFEVNLQLFLKDKKSNPRSLLFFVIRDHLGTTPLANLRNTLIADLTNIWTSLSKPKGLENSRIEDYFDFGFAALPHKILQPDKFLTEVGNLGTRFRAGHRTSKEHGFDANHELEGGIFLPEYHRRIPADGFSVYAQGVWDQIVSNKDLDLPTQQELLAQFRCDEISREVLEAFDVAIQPLEEKQAEGVRLGKPAVLKALGASGAGARLKSIKAFEVEASRYHKGVYARKRVELEGKIDTRLKALYNGQLSAANKAGVASFSDAVSAAVKAGQKKGASYEFAEIVEREKKVALAQFEAEARSLAIEGVPWTNFKQQYVLYEKDLNEVSSRLRKEEMRRLATRVERWVRSRLGDSVGLEFNKLGSGRGGSGAPETGEKPATEKDLWDRIWNLFVATVREAETRFVERAKSFDADQDEIDIGLWRLRRKSWGVLRARIDEEVMEGNILLKLRENFEDKFRYDEAGVPRIWRPTDDIEGMYTKAKESTLTLIPLLSRFRLAETYGPPDLPEWIGNAPTSVDPKDEEDLTPIGGVDEEEGKSLEEEMTILGEAKRQDLVVRFKKTADGVYVEAKRSAIGGVAQVPLYFYGLLLALGWNEIVAVLRNPVYFIFLILLGVAAYVTYTLNLWGPMLRMANAASAQAVEIGKEKLREFLESSDTGRQALAMKGRYDDDDAISLNTLDSRGKKKASVDDEDDDDDI
ncbi:Dynamin-like GTPase that mediates homotypic ER fusion [Cadophora gregata]|uniref:Dynamin-like GTPase that mediates homotypic ER fusion n=1 Tax=Cadophora gregata TaxID=51156 RepID=UPI0026DAD819|nr:Dynamin-like GTPase that mediates homotypic ER fusion [Cadophora gregata]KAK0122266.1 Dynamin-like GTPase that mediates homotypic ER fusion [Cadophora gregata]KAK0127742.1 Dynamin-like GTPase that mediates homotypic ER fusion [Cadophora gregata f. sp. sojae]